MGEVTLDPGLGLNIWIGAALERPGCEDSSCSGGDPDGIGVDSVRLEGGLVGFSLRVVKGLEARVF